MSRGDADRSDVLREVFSEAFGADVKANPLAFRRKFRKMASNPIAFYRGSSPLFYFDVTAAEDPWTGGDASSVWIHGDLHAENFGTYMDAHGTIIFDVNDFDEAYVGPFTWDVRRMSASVALQAYAKAASDEEIRALVRNAVESYVDHVEAFHARRDTEPIAVTRESATGHVLDLLSLASLRTRASLLDSVTVIEDRRRRFTIGDGHRSVEGDERARVLRAFAEYAESIHGNGSLVNRVKDVMVRIGVGIGSAGLPSYNFLLEGETQALESDLIVYMKQAQVATPSRFSADPRVAAHFLHDGHRTALAQRALHGASDPWLGHCTLQGIPQVVAEASPYTVDLDWNVVDVDSMHDVASYLGRAAATIHCMADSDADETPVTICADDAILKAIGDGRDAFITDMVQFAERYAEQVRDDHRAFFNLFRNDQLLLS